MLYFSHIQQIIYYLKNSTFNGKMTIFSVYTSLGPSLENKFYSYIPINKTKTKCTFDYILFS